MKRLFILLAVLIGLLSCQSGKTVLPKSEYTIIDTLSVHKNIVNYTFGYNVIIEYNNDCYYAFENAKGRLIYVNLKKLNVNTENNENKN
jgi:lipopolysaccharide export LptBFGC system permease protein LptF